MSKTIQGIRKDIDNINAKIAKTLLAKDNAIAVHNEYNNQYMLCDNTKKAKRLKALAGRYLNKANKAERLLNDLRNRLKRKEEIYKRLGERI